MSYHVRRRFWSQVSLTVLAAALLVLTLVRREWLEVLSGTDDLDGGSGALEWALVGALTVATAALGLMACLEWRRPLATRA